MYLSATGIPYPTLLLGLSTLAKYLGRRPVEDNRARWGGETVSVETQTPALLSSFPIFNIVVTVPMPDVVQRAR
ncbi:hypothetical protein BOTBODRAFT_70041 [Botryobasidium botryosum FD-172 SS1]|uniref:Uncharacterized protein n=1 Tax=Botryobasidium botryosum (strain FD-172 SS1) TaxID=930990 RepID=A0A067M084_BOTB1|nr:hypothetical protein BOTBODRAFT_70041 [Botryobasidium botryosum FD-172 SS1]